MKNLNVFVERIGNSKNKTIEVNLTVVWKSGAICKKVNLDEDLLNELLLKNSFDAKQLMIQKVFGQGAI